MSTPAPPPAAPKSPEIFNVQDIKKKLQEWRVMLNDVKATPQEHPVTEACICARCKDMRDCRKHLDRWLDELLAVRGL
jgi:hypothetical protein